VADAVPSNVAPNRSRLLGRMTWDGRDPVETIARRLISPPAPTPRGTPRGVGAGSSRSHTLANKPLAPVLRCRFGLRFAGPL